MNRCAQWRARELCVIGANTTKIFSQMWDDQEQLLEQVGM